MASLAPERSAPCPFSNLRNFQARGLARRLNKLRPRSAVRVYLWANAVHFQRLLRRWPHKHCRAFALFSQPLAPVLRPQNNWHSVMHACRHFVGRAGDERTGAHLIVAPVLPYPCEHHGCAVSAAVIPWQLVARRTLAPLVIARRGDKAATLTGRRAKGWLFRYCLCARVDQKRAIAWRFVPLRNEPPTHAHQTAPVSLHAHNVNVTCRADVVVWTIWQSICRRRREQLRHGISREGYGKASTHGPIKAQPSGDCQQRRQRLLFTR